MTRDRRLDGLRGVAALCVAFSHVSAIVWMPLHDPGAPPGGILSSAWQLGAPSVDLFFVLSGYVLSRFLSQRRPDWGTYAATRAARLLPVAWTGILLGLASRHLAATIGLPSGSGFLLRHLLLPIDPRNAVGLLTMTVPPPDADLVDAPLWSMVIEMHASLLLPLAVPQARRDPVVFAILATAALAILGTTLPVPYPFYLTGFVLGTALAAGEDRLPRLPRPIVLAACGLPLLASRALTGSEGAMLRMTGAFGALLLIIAVRRGFASRILLSRCAQTLGRISYPLYAIHFPIMAAAAILLPSVVPTPLACLASIPISLLAAAVVERTVDAPAIRLSRRLRRRATAPAETAEA